LYFFATNQNPNLSGLFSANIENLHVYNIRACPKQPKLFYPFQNKRQKAQQTFLPLIKRLAGLEPYLPKIKGDRGCK
jgi:hypothetical protein